MAERRYVVAKLTGNRDSGLVDVYGDLPARQAPIQTPESAMLQAKGFKSPHRNNTSIWIEEKGIPATFLKGDRQTGGRVW